MISRVGELATPLSILLSSGRILALNIGTQSTQALSKLGSFNIFVGGSSCKGVNF